MYPRVENYIWNLILDLGWKGLHINVIVWMKGSWKHTLIDWHWHNICIIYFLNHKLYLNRNYFERENGTLQYYCLVRQTLELWNVFQSLELGREKKNYDFSCKQLIYQTQIITCGKRNISHKTWFMISTSHPYLFEKKKLLRW